MVRAKHGERRDDERSMNGRKQSTLEACCRRGWREEKSSEGTPGDGGHREGQRDFHNGTFPKNLMSHKRNENPKHTELLFP